MRAAPAIVSRVMSEKNKVSLAPRDDETAGWAIVGHLGGGMAVYGVIGWLMDQWLGHAPLFLAIGLFLGLTLALVAVVLRYGKQS